MRNGRRVLLLDGGRPGGVYRLGDPSSAELRELLATTKPVPGMDGWRRDTKTGERWYSSEWLGVRE